VLFVCLQPGDSSVQTDGIHFDKPCPSLPPTVPLQSSPSAILTPTFHIYSPIWIEFHSRDFHEIVLTMNIVKISVGTAVVFLWA
jgi:hypothetical protein